MSDEHGPEEDVLDVLGIGFGPSNLALAIALHELGGGAPRALFLEKQAQFGWHRGMLLDDATMQVSFFKDLVTMRNPTSDFSFLCYLRSVGRLAEFVNHKTLFPLRIEFHDYFRWAAERVPGLVRYGSEVLAIEPVRSGGGVAHFEVLSREGPARPHGEPDALVLRRARNICLATGLTPRMPADAPVSDRVWHNVELVPRAQRLAADPPGRFVVVGAGQSAAETVAYLHRTFPAAEICAVFAKFGYTPADDSPYANRIFDPAAVDTYFGAPPDVKRMLVDYHRSTNYSAVDLELIEALYHEEYRERVLGRRRLRILNASRVRHVRPAEGGLQVAVEHLPTGEVTHLQVDQLVYATGYRPPDVATLLGGADLLCVRDGDGHVAVGRDYRVQLQPGVTAGVYLLGGTEHAHGLSATLLSNTAVRAGEVLASLLTDQATAARPPAAPPPSPTARWSAAKQIAARGTPVEEAPADDRFAPFPLTDQQQAYLVGRSPALELGNVSTHAYYEYEGELDLARFDRAWQRVIDRHDMLRAVIVAEREEQRVLPEVPPFAADVVDLRGLSAGEAQRRLAGIRARMSHEVRPADRYPMFGVVVSRLTDARARVHISFDGLTLDYLSWQLLVADLTRFYADPRCDIPALELTFRDYVLAEAAQRECPAYRRSEEYWTARIADLPPAPRLPLRTDPATIGVPRWTSRAGTVDAAAWAGLKTRAARSGLTPTALVLAAFAEVLAVWGEEPRFTINVPRMNRVPLHPQANEILGEFASFSLLAVDHRGDAPFADRAAAVQAQLWADLAHQHVSGVRVLRELIRAEGGFRRALMPVVLTSTLGFTAGPSPLLGSQLRRVFAISQTPQVYLDVQVEEDAGALVYNWDSVEELFPPGMLDDAFAAFGRLLARLGEDAAAWAATDLGLVPEQHHGRGGIAGPARPVPELLVQDLFALQVRRRPDSHAVVAPAMTLTYRQLDDRATRVANWLREAAGGTPAAPVAVVMDKGWEQVVAAYGVLRAGAPYVPIDASLPPARLAQLLEQCGTGAVLTQPWLAAELGRVLAGEGAVRRVLAVDHAGLKALPAKAPPVVQKPGDPAYVLYTSGSTGRPKGVLISHRGMVNCLLRTIETFAIGPADRVLAVTALHHDMSTFDLFGILGAGGTVVLPDAARVRDAAHWSELAAQQKVTVWNSVPAMMEMLLEHTQSPERSLPALRLAFLGGDWIPLHVPPALAAAAPGAQLVSVGGPTETTLWNIWYPVRSVDPAWRSIPYGRPIANTRYRIVDGWLRDRPDGVIGELCVSGPGVALGYRDDPAATAGAFVRDPATAERLYRTGDLGRVLPDGEIEFVGRADSQVKIRGQRIELGEVEAALAVVPGVAGAVVTAVARADRPGHRALAAHVTLAPGDPAAAGPGPEEIRAALREQLPEHMVPSTVTVLERLPLTPNGKVDRAGLATAAQALAPGPDGFVAPASPLEQVLAGVWAEVLEVERVGVHDDFFALGGDSVLATRIVVRLREALDTPELALLSLFTTVTVRQLGEALLAAEDLPGRLGQVAEIYLHVAAVSADDVEARLTPR